MKKYLSLVCMIFFVGNFSNAQTKAQVNWEQLESTLCSTHLKEFYYKKESLFNEAEGITSDYEIPTAWFFSTHDSTNKNLAFMLGILPLEHFHKDGIMDESIAYTYKGKQCYYRETEYIQGLYMSFEKQGLSVCIGFRKMARHDQKFIENLFDELNPESILETGFKK